MEDPPPRSFDLAKLREAMARRLYRRSVAMGQIRLPAVPTMIDEYVRMCGNLFASVGTRFTAEEFTQLRPVLEGELATAHAASSRSNIIISFHAPFGTALNYRVTAESSTITGEYDHWVGTREGPLAMSTRSGPTMTGRIGPSSVWVSSCGLAPPLCV